MASLLDVQAFNNGRIYLLEDGPELRILGYDGTGLMSFQRISQKTPGQLGATDLGYGQEQRMITFLWVITGRDLPDYYRLRSRLLEAFIPHQNTPIYLAFTAPDGTQRAVFCHLQGNLDFLAADRKRMNQRVSASLLCPDPRFFDPVTGAVTVFIDSISDGWTIDNNPGDPDSAYGWTIGPGTRGWLVGESLFEGEVTIPYADLSPMGAPEYPTMTIYGPIDGPVITNTTTGEKVDLTAGAGLSLAEGEYVTIDLANGPFGSGSPTIRDDSGASVEQYLTTDSDLGTFHLAPAGELLSGTLFLDDNYADGNNVITVDGLNTGPATRVGITYYNRFRGF